MEAGESAPRRVCKPGVLRGATNFFAVQVSCGVVLARKDDQQVALALLMALK